MMKPVRYINVSRTLVVRLLSLVLVSALGQTSLAQNQGATTPPTPVFPILECPAVGDEYEKLVSQLEAIQASIRKEANCENVSQKVKDLGDRIARDRDKVIGIVENSNEQPLTAEQAKSVRDYAENVTKQVVSLNDLFMRSNRCFQDDQAESQLAALSAVVNESSQLVGKLAGPYGAPIAIAGTLAAGFLTGLDQVLQSRAGYDFKKREQWMNYVQNLCTYHSYRDQIDHLLNPRQRISQLQEFRLQLESQLQNMTQQCSECRDLEYAYANQKSAGGELPDQAALNAQAKRADLRFNLPLGSYTLQSLGLRDWALSEMERIRKESQSYWGDASGRHLLSRAKDQLEGFLIDREAPRFITYQISTARNDFSDFEQYSGYEGRRLYAQIIGIDSQAVQSPIRNWTWSNPIEFFRALVIRPLNWNRLNPSRDVEDLQFAWKNYRQQSLSKLGHTQTSLQVAQSFCSFFKHSGHYNPALRGQCTSGVFRRLLEQNASLENELVDAKVFMPAKDAYRLDPRFLDDDKLDQYSRNRFEALSRALRVRAL